MVGTAAVVGGRVDHDCRRSAVWLAVAPISTLRHANCASRTRGSTPQFLGVEGLGCRGSATRMHMKRGVRRFWAFLPGMSTSTT